MRSYYVYIMANRSKMLYTGVTNDLERRVGEHKEKKTEGFTKKYNITRLVYFEEFNDIRAAIAREKEIKRWARSKKVRLIFSMNNAWRDLAEDWIDRNLRLSSH